MKRQGPIFELFVNFNQIYSKGGLRSFYKGLSVTLVRSIPTGGISFVAYEYAKEQINNGHAQSQTHE